MLDNLTQRLAKAVKTLRGQARITEENISESLREIRLALLEADVALPVVKELINTVKERAIGEEVIGSLTPGQALVGVVHQTLTQLMGKEAVPLNFSVTPPAIILMAGLQGVGKTTTVGKLALYLKNQKKKVLLVSTDIYRPAAIKQLKTLADQLTIDCFPSTSEEKPRNIALSALDWAKRHYHDVLIVDTAGRLSIDSEMMDEIKDLHSTLKPIETLYVVDSMQGQDAVNTAKVFADTLPLTGIVLTKLDGDSRGGAALSVRQITGQPIKFIGVSEKMNGLETFHPERMASRILGMGDVLSLIEATRHSIDEEKAVKLAQKFKSGATFDLNDFKDQISQMKNMGGLSAFADKLPAQFAEAASKIKGDSEAKTLKRIIGIIDSMTPLERVKPELIKASRKKRIATGAGVQVQEVNRLLNQYEQMSSMMKKLSKGGISKLLKSIPGLMRG